MTGADSMFFEGYNLSRQDDDIEVWKGISDDVPRTAIVIEFCKGSRTITAFSVGNGGTQLVSLTVKEMDAITKRAKELWEC